MNEVYTANCEKIEITLNFETKYSIDPQCSGHTSPMVCFHNIIIDQKKKCYCLVSENGLSGSWLGMPTI